PGAPARAAALAGAARRLRPAQRLAPLERPRDARPRARARCPLHLGLLADGQGLAAEGALDDARRRDLSRDDHGDRRDVPPPRGGRLLRRDRQAPPALRDLVRGAPRRVRRDRARLVPPDSDRQRARPRPRRSRLLARAVSGDSRSAPLVPPARAAREGAPAPAARRRGRPRSGRRRLAAHHRPRAPPAERAGRTVLPLALPRPQELVGVASLLALGRAGRALAPHYRQGAR